MNLLKKLTKSSAVVSLLEFKHLVYLVLLSDVVSEETDLRKLVRYNGTYEEFLDLFPDWDSLDDNESEIVQTLYSLEKEGLISFNEEGEYIYVGALSGRKFVPFMKVDSLYKKAVDKLTVALDEYRKNSFSKGVSRSKFIYGKLKDKFLQGTTLLNPNDFTSLHSYLYEIYTGGEIYTIRNQKEYYQTNNMLKAYDKDTVFAILVEGVLNYDVYRVKGIPTLTNVAFIKDEIFHNLVKPKGKDYMRSSDSITEEGF